MKIHIELDVAPNEVGLATELLGTLRLLTEHVKGRSADAVPAPPAVVIKNTKELLTGLIERLGQPGASLEQVASEIATVLSSSPLDEAQQVEEFVAIFEANAFNPRLLSQSHAVVPFVELLPRLPENVRSKIRDKIIQKVLALLTRKRPVSTDRKEFFLQAEAFAALVKIEFVAIDGACQTIEKLIAKPDTRSAAVTMLGKTVELCGEKLQTKCSPAHLGNLAKALAKVTEDTFMYDLQYINSNIRWPDMTPPSTASSTASSATPPPANLPPGMPLPAAPAAAAQPLPNGAAAAAPAAAPQAPPAAVPPAQVTMFAPATSFDGHTDSVFSVCYDPLHMQLVSGGKDGQVLVWNLDGSIATRIHTPNHFICSLEVNPTNGSLMVCGVVHEHAAPGSKPLIAAYDTNHAWHRRGGLDNTAATVVSCLRIIPGEGEMIATGETYSVHGMSREVVCLYDLSRSASMENTLPLQTWAEHTDLVSSVCPTSNPHIIVSASRDNSIRFWDRRMDHSVAAVPNAHSDLITNIDYSGETLVSSSMDTMMRFWDMRMLTAGSGTPTPLAMFSVDGQGIMKIATSGAPRPNLAAVSTFNTAYPGFYLCDFTNLSSPAITTCSAWPDGRLQEKSYHDIKWAAGQPLLFACAEKTGVDIFHVTVA